MIIGVPKEIKPSEHRVGITPSTASRLIDENHTVLVQKNSGDEFGNRISGTEFAVRNANVPEMLVQNFPPPSLHLILACFHQAKNLTNYHRSTFFLLTL